MAVIVGSLLDQAVRIRPEKAEERWVSRFVFKVLRTIFFLKIRRAIRQMGHTTINGAASSTATDYSLSARMAATAYRTQTLNCGTLAKDDGWVKGAKC